jgi:hypothetical protein
MADSTPSRQFMQRTWYGLSRREDEKWESAERSVPTSWEILLPGQKQAVPRPKPNEILTIWIRLLHGLQFIFGAKLVIKRENE